MIEIFGLISGLLGSAVPKVFNYFQDKADKKQELEILRLQIERESKGHSDRLEEIESSGYYSQVTEAYKTYNTDNKYINIYNGSVRPSLAYFSFFVYAASKYLGMEWGEFDSFMFSSVIGFYFGARSWKPSK